MVTYGDRLFARVVEKHPIVRTDAMGSLRRFVRALEPKGTTMFRHPNPDLPEALDRRLDEAIAMNWRPESERRYVIVIGDAPAYPQERDNAFARAARFATQQGQHVSTVMVARRDAEAFFSATGNRRAGRVRGRRWEPVHDRERVAGDVGCLKLGRWVERDAMWYQWGTRRLCVINRPARD